MEKKSRTYGLLFISLTAFLSSLINYSNCNLLTFNMQIILFPNLIYYKIPLPNGSLCPKTILPNLFPSPSTPHVSNKNKQQILYSNLPLI